MTFDPTKNLVPWGLLTSEQQAVLRGWPGPIEWWDVARGTWVTLANGLPDMESEGVVYRAVPLPVLRSTVRWEFIHPACNWVTWDKDGTPYAQAGKKPPVSGMKVWHPDNETFGLGGTVGIAIRGDEPWTEAIVERPRKSGAA
jgi:hypothetical protein